MKTESWARWSEIIASVAVIVTLAFLVVELRTTRQVLERQATLDRAAVLLDPFVENPHLSDILAKVFMGRFPPEVELLVNLFELTPAEAITYDRHLWAIWFGANADYRLEGETPELRALVADMMSSDHNWQWWQIARDYGYFDPTFVALVEGHR
ncbi:MAG TPA: hypothetical protein VLA33_07075 [Gemmatimonadota bacterium]|nr:hypothetical protein [Gemmatimonadota bacterium]